jgi:hypothetical protein
MATNARDGALLDELLLDIFARLPDPVDLLRCAGTCTRWFRLLAADDAAFLRRAGVLQQNRNTSVLLGAFYQNDYLVPGSATANNVSDCPPRFWRLDDLARPSPSIGLFSKDDGLFNYAQPLASRQGLLLVRLMPAPLDHRMLQLAVCHPLLGGVHLVPPPPLHLHPPFLGRDLTGYALVTGYGGEGLDSHRQRRLAFRVLFTAVSLDEVVCAYSYSSATGNWSAPLACPVQLRGLTMSGPRAGVVDHRGTVHWLYRSETSFYSLDVSADAARVSLMKMPMQMQLPPPFPCIGAGGKVSFVYTRPEGDAALLQLWTRQDQDGNNGGGWLCSHLGHLTRTEWPYDLFIIIGFVESRGAILIKDCHGLFCFDIESAELEWVRGSKYDSYPREVCSNSTCQGYNSCTKCIYNNSVLCEMDWSSYLLHLSAWSPQEAQQGETRARKIC